MGIPFLWPFVKRKGYMAETVERLPQGPRPPETRYLVDVLGSMYPVIRRIFLKHDSATANHVFEQHIRSLQLPSTATILYVDGPSPAEKRATHGEREARRKSALAKAHTLLLEMESLLRQGKKLRKQQFQKLNKHINASFYLLPNLRATLAQYLEANGWTVVTCPSEADIQIALDCTAKDVVISADSDSLIHPSICTIWRPLARGGYLEYNVRRLLEQLELTRTGLTVLGIVCRNDYTTNMKRMGLHTNYDIIHSLEGNGIYFVFYFIIWQSDVT
jgi:5'-3' exonuclease